jgi:hypothetical protein
MIILPNKSFRFQKFMLTNNIFLITLFLSLLMNPVIAQENEAEATVQAQLDAYNQRDIDAFMLTFSDDCSLYRLGDNTPWAQGSDQVRKIYQGMFEQSPGLHSKLLSRSVVGNTVFDHEWITGRNGSDEPLELMMIYVVENGKIAKAYSVRK